MWVCVGEEASQGKQRLRHSYPCRPTGVWLKKPGPFLSRQSDGRLGLGCVWQGPPHLTGGGARCSVVLVEVRRVGRVAEGSKQWGGVEEAAFGRIAARNDSTATAGVVSHSLGGALGRTGPDDSHT